MKICPECQTKFPPESRGHTARFCSPKCSQKAWRERMRGIMRAKRNKGQGGGECEVCKIPLSRYNKKSTCFLHTKGYYLEGGMA